MSHSSVSPIPVMQQYMTLLLNQKGLREEGSFMLYTTKTLVGLTGNLSCSRTGGPISIWEEIKE